MGGHIGIRFLRRAEHATEHAVQATHTEHWLCVLVVDQQLEALKHRHTNSWKGGIKRKLACTAQTADTKSGTRAPWAWLDMPSVPVCEDRFVETFPCQCLGPGSRAVRWPLQRRAVRYHVLNIPHNGPEACRATADIHTSAHGLGQSARRAACHLACYKLRYASTSACCTCTNIDCCGAGSHALFCCSLTCQACHKACCCG